MFTIRKEVPRNPKIVLAIFSFVAIMVLWFGLTVWNVLPPFSLPKPLGVLQAFKGLWVDYDLLGNVAMSWWRIFQAFAWCVVVAVPLGLLMGSFKVVDALVNPITAPMRSMPITAFLPVFLAVFGMDETMKIAFLFFGMFFSLLAVVTDEVNKVEPVLLETAYTLGAKKHQVIWLMFRSSIPAIFSSFRILYDIGWTYVILAEMVNARKGIGYMIEAARKVMDFDRVYAGIIALGIAAFLFRILLSRIEFYLFPYRRPKKA